MKCFIPFIAPMFLAGCQSFEEHIDRPEAEGGMLLESSCGLNQGPGRWDTIEFAKDDVRVRIFALQGRKGLSVNVILKIPEGTVVQVEGGKGRLVSLSLAKISSLRAQSYWRVEGSESQYQDINTPDNRKTPSRSSTKIPGRVRNKFQSAGSD